jgi:hypothetical protein
VVETFYQTFSQVSFTLLGLWMAVAGARYNRWAVEPGLRRMAYVVFLHFALPGVMSVFTLVAPDQQGVWHATFAVTATLGAGGLWLLRVAPGTNMRRSRLLSAMNAVGMLVYVLVAVVAVVPSDTVADAFDVDPLQVEGGLLTVMVFLGVNLGWLLFDEVEHERATAGSPF